MLLVLFSVITTVAGIPTGQPTFCCKSKTVGGIGYTFSSQMDTTAFNCSSNCAYHKDGDTSVQYCFAKGDQDAVCTDDKVEEVVGILITGGYYVDTTEVFLPGTGKTCVVDGLPDGATIVDPVVYCCIENACSIPAGDTTIITGGYDNPTGVERYNQQGHIVEDLPRMSYGRYSHGCGAYQDGEDTILVVAGGWSLDDARPRSSTEVHIIGTYGWTGGQPLPNSIAILGMASASLDHEVIMIGGEDRGNYGDYSRSENYQDRSEILSYRGGWTEVGQLTDARGYAAATKILVNPTVCD